ncbi:MAG TPA: thiamine phosphate synthase [Roseiarcus sp.]|nr:thiamine phosphate synthase [Roseiarcus sp.]
MPDARLYLITPALSAADLAAFAPRFAEALAAGDVASALVRLAPGADARRVVGPLLEIAAAGDVALLIEHDARLAARLGADGVHVEGPQVAEAVESLKSQRIVGAGALMLRDDAMAAGEAGADYVMFGEPGASSSFEATLERVGWWAEIFEAPCVAYAAGLDEVAALAAAGADFIALSGAVWEAASAAEAVRAATQGLARRP